MKRLLTVLIALLSLAPALAPSAKGGVVKVVDRQGDVLQSATYYPYGEPTVEPSGQPYFFGGKERIHAGGRNIHDFGARSLTPYGQWSVIDPKSETFYPVSPYSYCAGDPINYVDPDGRELKVITEEFDNEFRINIELNGVVYNSSSQEFDMQNLAAIITQQLNSIFTFSNGGLNVSMNAKIRAVDSPEQILEKDHVFKIVDIVDKKNNALAKTNKSGGLGISIGTELVNQTISGSNSRSIAHEVGHSAGLGHTNQSVDKDSNLMTQIKYLSNTQKVNEARFLTTEQLFKIVDKYEKGQLNKDSAIRTNWQFSHTNSQILIIIGSHKEISF